MKINPKVSLARVSRAVERSMRELIAPGFCVACGASHGEVEPDARGYPCHRCGAAGVYGAEELLLELAF